MIRGVHTVSPLLLSSNWELPSPEFWISARGHCTLHSTIAEWRTNWEAETVKREKRKEEQEEVDYKSPLTMKERRRVSVPFLTGKDGTEPQEQAQNSDPGRAHQTSKIDQKIFQLMRSPMVFFFFFQLATAMPKAKNFSSYLMYLLPTHNFFRPLEWGSRVCTTMYLH